MKVVSKMNPFRYVKLQTEHSMQQNKIEVPNLSSRLRPKDTTKRVAAQPQPRPADEPSHLSSPSIRREDDEAVRMTPPSNRGVLACVDRLRHWGPRLH